MKIAILGSRGIPNRYGGFEAFTENLAHRLVEDGHDVIAYCRKSFTRPGDEKLIDPRICHMREFGCYPICVMTLPPAMRVR